MVVGVAVFRRGSDGPQSAVGMMTPVWLSFDIAQMTPSPTWSDESQIDVGSIPIASC